MEQQKLYNKEDKLRSEKQNKKRSNRSQDKNCVFSSTIVFAASIATEPL